MELKELFKYLESIDHKLLKNKLNEYGGKRTYKELVSDSFRAEILYKGLRKLRQRQLIIESKANKPLPDSVTLKSMVFTLDEVCDIVKKKKTTLYYWRKNGKLLALNPDEKRTAILYSRETIENYLKGLAKK